MFASPFHIYRLSLFTAVVLLAVGVLVLLVGFAAQVSFAAGSSTPQTTFVVTTNADTNDGSCDAHCTLREAIVAANTLTGSDVILFSLSPESHTITLTSLLPNIRDDVIIDGSGVLSLTVSGNNLWRVFTIFNISDPNIQAMLTNMSIVNGYANNVPGGIWNRSLGTVILDNVLVKGNVGGFGGGVSNERGVLLVHSSTFINNSAGGGGGIYNESGTLVISDSYFRGNEASSLGGGVVSGGFSFATETVVSNTIFVDNMAAYGGGIFSNAVLTLTNSTFSHNLASVYGGGMLNNGEIIISHTTFFSNTAGHSGGAINNGNSLVLYDSTFNGNSAIQYGGAIVNFGTEFFSATVTATNSLFQGNMAGYGGGIANWMGYKVIVNNSTLSGNTTITSGGGISNSTILELNNVTLSDNEAAVAGGITSSGVMSVSNSIIANSIGGDCANSGLFNINVHNLVEDGSCNPLLSGDPWLGPLADNGGATWTHALLSGSPALDAGDAATCEPTDQRGVTRPLDGDGDGTAVCDMGAVEQELTNTPTPTPTPTYTPTPTATPTPTVTPPPPSFRVYLPVIWKEG